MPQFQPHPLIAPSRGSSPSTAARPRTQALSLLAVLITLLTLGICYPFAVVLRQRWHAKHSYIDGQQLVFNGSAWSLFGNWIKWLLLCIITIGIYAFWVGPRLIGGSGRTLLGQPISPASSEVSCREVEHPPRQPLQELVLSAW